MLVDDVTAYIAVRRAAGYKVKALERYLSSFAHFATSQGDEYIVVQTAIDWAGRTTTAKQAYLRLQQVILLARYCRAEDTRHQIPPRGVSPSYQRRPTPYIYSAKEQHDLINQASGLEPTDGLRPHTYSTLITLLIMTGLRISEALALRFSDFGHEGLHIRDSKFRKSRIVPLHPTGHATLQQYIDRRREYSDIKEDHIFISRRRRVLSCSAVRRTFRELLDACGIARHSGKSRPRLMDLRHTYATTVLLAGPGNRDHVGRHMLALSTAMGHSSIAATFWYLESTPTLMNDIAHACQKHIDGGSS